MADRIVERPLGDLKFGDWIAVQAGQNAVRELVHLPPVTGLNTFRQRSRSGRADVRQAQRPIRVPARLDPNLAWLLGYYVGNGTTRKSGAVRICVPTPKVGLVTGYVKRTFGFTPRACRTGRATDKALHLSLGTQVGKVFRALGLGRKEAAKCRIPDVVLRSTEKVVRAFLSGLWGADGYRPKPAGNKPYLVTVYPRLAEEVAVLIYWIGDYARIHRVDSRKYLPDVPYRVRVQYRVEWHDARHRERDAGGGPARAAEVPLSFHLTPDLRAAGGGQRGWRRGSVPRARLRRFDPGHPLLRDDVYYVRVEAVRKLGRRTVYDAMNEPTHTLSLNGVLAHNCSWGSATASKIHTFSLERLRAEMEWIAAREIAFVYSASANFGQLPRDTEIAGMLADVRRRTGFPKKWFSNTAKNSTSRIYDIFKILHDAGLAKAATLSPQTWDKDTLVTIKRSNIKPKTYQDLQKMFTDAGILTYSEILCGLPGETLDSFCAGIDAEIEMGQHDGITIYPLRVLPGTEMAEPMYRAAHGIVTRRTPILANHADLSASTVGPVEFEESVIATSTMPLQDYRTASLVSWFVQAFFGLGLARFPLLWLKEQHGVPATRFARWCLSHVKVWPAPLASEYHRASAQILEMTGALAVEMPPADWNDLSVFPKIRWPLEEATWLALSLDRDETFRALFRLIYWFCHLAPTTGIRGLGEAIDRNKRELIHWSTDPEYRDPADFAKFRLWYGRRGKSLLRGDP